MSGHETKSFALVRKPSSAVDKTAPRTKCILSGMVSETLALVKKSNVDSDALVREGKRLYNADEWTDENWQAMELFQRAAEAGHVEAQFFMFECSQHLHSILESIGDYGIELNKTTPIEWLRKSAESGFAEAQYVLADCYRRGDEVPEDMVEAVRWYRKAAEQGDADAQYKLGMCYQHGRGVVKDEMEAEKWQDKAREKWSASAEGKIERKKIGADF